MCIKQLLKIQKVLYHRVKRGVKITLSQPRIYNKNDIVLKNNNLNGSITSLLPSISFLLFFLLLFFLFVVVQSDGTPEKCDELPESLKHRQRMFLFSEY